MIVKTLCGILLNLLIFSVGINIYLFFPYQAAMLENASLKESLFSVKRYNTLLLIDNTYYEEENLRLKEEILTIEKYVSVLDWSK